MDVISKEEYDALKLQHEEGCKSNDYNKMIMIGSDNYKKMQSYKQTVCEHLTVISHQGGQVDECIDCGKRWG